VCRKIWSDAWQQQIFVLPFPRRAVQELLGFDRVPAGPAGGDCILHRVWKSTSTTHFFSHITAIPVFNACWHAIATVVSGIRDTDVNQPCHDKISGFRI
jgi:hypothetical protein